jgi:hypothetical protein
LQGAEALTVEEIFVVDHALILEGEFFNPGGTGLLRSQVSCLILLST